MKISVVCKPNAKQAKVEKADAVTYRVAVRSAPEDGAANREVVELLADYFSVPVSSVVILTGQKSRRKLVAVEGDSQGATPPPVLPRVRGRNKRKV